MRKSSSLFLTAVGISIAAFNVQGGLISDTATFDVYNSVIAYATGTSDRDPGRTNYQYLTLDRFDSGWGTLTGVSINVTSHWWHDVWGYAKDDSDPFLGEDNVEIQSGGQATYLIRLDDPYQAVLGAGHGRGVLCRDDDGYCSETWRSGLRSLSGGLDLTGFSLDQFIGSDPLSIEISNFQESDIWFCEDGGVDWCSLLSDGRFYGSVEVTYEYEPQVSEPTILVLMGIGLAGIGVARKWMVA